MLITKIFFKLPCPSCSCRCCSWLQMCYCSCSWTACLPGLTLSFYTWPNAKNQSTPHTEHLTWQISIEAYRMQRLWPFPVFRKVSSVIIESIPNNAHNIWIGWLMWPVKSICMTCIGHVSVVIWFNGVKHFPITKYNI